jgi:UDP-N-acetylbacillosamine N-acetyltransferase
VKAILYGAGGHGRVVADILAALPGIEAVGFIDDDSERHGRVLGTLTVLGGSDQLITLRDRGVSGAVVTIGANAPRSSKAAALVEVGMELITAIHPSAVLAPDVVVGPGTVIMAGVIVNAAARIGRNVIINTGATVDHECILGDGSHISPGANLAGNVDVGDGAHIGIGCSVVPGVRIGSRSTVGAGAVVLHDVPADETWAGNPARRIERHRGEREGHGRP